MSIINYIILHALSPLSRSTYLLGNLMNYSGYVKQRKKHSPVNLEVHRLCPCLQRTFLCWVWLLTADMFLQFKPSHWLCSVADFHCVTGSPVIQSKGCIYDVSA